MSIDSGFWPTDVQFGTVTYPSKGKLGPRIQLNLQLVMLHSGSMTVWVDGKLRYVSANTVCVLFPGHEERFTFDETCETHHSWVHIRAPSLREELVARLAQLPWPLPLSLSMTQLTQDALAMQSVSLSTSAEIRKALAMQLLWHYIGEGEQHSLHSGTQECFVVKAACQFIWAHLHEPLTLTSLSNALAISSSYLIRLFQAQLHTTPMYYVWQCRVKKGLELLEQTGLSVGAIAEQCGFQSRYHFSRKVRQTVGVPPLEVRRRSWQR
ncbi:MAG: AraC family transcriptional regulator [Ktedonobacteraceae bacterium]